eukprot:3467702-Rhodomonas_salina.2
MKGRKGMRARGGVPDILSTGVTFSPGTRVPGYRVGHRTSSGLVVQLMTKLETSSCSPSAELHAVVLGFRAETPIIEDVAGAS